MCILYVHSMHILALQFVLAMQSHSIQKEKILLKNQLYKSGNNFKYYIIYLL